MQNLESFKFIGISVQTSNQNGQNAEDLRNLWGRFFAENLMEKIPNKISNNILTIYTDYQSDFQGSYTALIGYKVTSTDEVPNDLEAREFESGTFKKYTAKGIIPNAVIDTWEEIWDNDQILKRKYSYDFEVYGEKSQNGADSEVEIYIAV